MNDLISRDALRNALWKMGRPIYPVIEDADDLIARIPAVDAKPVRHGEWEEVPIQRSDKEIISCYACSLCGRILVNPFNYCPHCGAEMGGDDE